MRTLVQVDEGENVRQPGSDVRKGDAVMREGERITRGGGEVGTLVFVGRKEVSFFSCLVTLSASLDPSASQVKVYKKPVAAIMSTGNEIVDLKDQPAPSSSSPPEADATQWGGIYDTNRPSLRAVLESLGYDVVDLGIVPDE